MVGHLHADECCNQMKKLPVTEPLNLLFLRPRLMENSLCLPSGFSRWQRTGKGGKIEGVERRHKR